MKRDRPPRKLLGLSWEAIPLFLLLVFLAVLALASVGPMKAVAFGVGSASLAIYVVLQFRRVVRRRSWTVVQLVALPGLRFGLVIRNLLEEFGYRDIHEIDGGDGWADFHCHDRAGLPTLLRCSRPPPGSLVRSRDLKRFMRATSSFERTGRRIFITTSSFTLRAWQMARQHHVRAIHGTRLARLIDDVRVHHQQGHPIPVWDRFEL